MNGTVEMLNAGLGWANSVPGDFAIGALNGPGVVVGNFNGSNGTTRLRIGSTGNSGNFSGLIANGMNNVTSLTKVGAGTQKLSTPNTYTGGTRLEAGTIELSHGDRLGTGTLTLAGGTLKASDAGSSVSVEINVPTVLAAGTTSTLLTIGSTGNGRGIRLNQSLSGNGSLVVATTNSGTGAFARVAAADTHTGGTTINANAVLTYLIPGTFSGYASDIVNNGRLDFNGVNGTFTRNISGIGNITRSNPSDFTFAGAISGQNFSLGAQSRTFFATTSNLGAGSILMTAVARLIKTSAADAVLPNAITMFLGPFDFPATINNRGGTLTLQNLSNLFSGGGAIAFNIDDQATAPIVVNGPALGDSSGELFAIVVGGAHPTVGPVTVTNAIANSGGFQKRGPGALALNGTVSANGVNVVEGTLRGTGTISTAIAVNAGTALAPGAGAAGTMTVNGGLAFAPGSAFGVQITDGSMPASFGTGGSTLGLLPSPTSNTFLDKTGGAFPTGLDVLSLLIDLNETSFAAGEDYSYRIARGMGNQSGLSADRSQPLHLHRKRLAGRAHVRLADRRRARLRLCELHRRRPRAGGFAFARSWCRSLRRAPPPGGSLSRSRSG